MPRSQRFHARASGVSSAGECARTGKCVPEARPDAASVCDLTVRQRGTPESKTLEDAGQESDRQQLVGRYATRLSPNAAKAGGWRSGLYGNSLLLVMGARSATCSGPTSGRQRRRTGSREFLAVGTMVVFTVYLRQRGSPESKPVGAPHRKTDVSG